MFSTLFSPIGESHPNNRDYETANNIKNIANDILHIKKQQQNYQKMKPLKLFSIQSNLLNVYIELKREGKP
jgi:hypothetical protein